MEMQKEEAKMLQWHPAFFAEIQIELQEDAEHLIFENEHQLGTKPKEIDVLIISPLNTTVICLLIECFITLPQTYSPSPRWS